MPNEMNHGEIARRIELLKDQYGNPAAPQFLYGDDVALNQAATDERKIANGELAYAPVKCAKCTLHDHCKTEEIFIFSRLSENKRFCGVGWRKDSKPHE